MVTHLFRNRNRPRSQIDVRVGSSHLVETLLHLRRADYDWYHDNAADIEQELLELLEESVIPRMFEDDIEGFHRRRSPELFPDEKPEVGGRNIKSLNKPKNKGKNSRSKTGLQKKQIQNSEEQREKQTKDVYFAFGELIQLAYRLESLAGKGISNQHTLFFPQGGKDDFDCPAKLPHRILIWLSKIDPQNKTNPDPQGVGFCRPEMIPIGSLFREPKDDLSDDEA
eukprot:scaffold7987_cov200-Cylindrotheca_fusiformis.AAC.1